MTRIRATQDLDTILEEQRILPAEFDERNPAANLTKDYEVQGRAYIIFSDESAAHNSDRDDKKIKKGNPHNIMGQTRSYLLVRRIKDKYAEKVPPITSRAVPVHKSNIREYETIMMPGPMRTGLVRVRERITTYLHSIIERHHNDMRP